MTRLKSRTVYLVSADTLYDGSTPVKVFTTKPTAQVFADRCRQYTETKPKCPPSIEDTAENDAEWDKWRKRTDRWEARHPAGKEHCSYNMFSVAPIKLMGRYRESTPCATPI